MSLEQLVLLLHLLGAGVLIGIVFFALVFSYAKPSTPEKLQTAATIAGFGKYASIWQLLTGLYLAWQNWGDIHAITWFWLKLVLFVLAGPTAELLIKRKVALAGQGDVASLKTVRLGAWLLVAMVLAIVTVGFALVEIY